MAKSEVSPTPWSLGENEGKNWTEIVDANGDTVAVVAKYDGDGDIEDFYTGDIIKARHNAETIVQAVNEGESNEQY